MRGFVILLALMISTQALGGNKSVYTDFDLRTCKQLSPETSGEDGESSGVIECRGLKGLPVTFAEGDLRSFLAFGKNGEQHCAFHQTFGGFNSTSNKIEWRLKNGKPVATIVRWTVSYDPADSTKSKTWLVVTKLDKGNSCHMGYVEGGFPKANQKARDLADAWAEGFICKTGKTLSFANAGTVTDGMASSGGCER